MISRLLRSASGAIERRHDTQEALPDERRIEGKKMLRLLCFTAHPDDEAGGLGGNMLHYAERGVENHRNCVMPGQAATHRGTARSDDELSAMRRSEFETASRLLKVSRGIVLDYPDGKLDHQDFHAVVADLPRRVRELRPHVVMTMGTEGAITA